MPYAALTAAALANPEALLRPPPIATKPRGNPNLGVAPAQPARGLDPRGAHTRRRCPRRSPAIHGKLRCCLHGGRRLGPHTPESLPRRRPGGRIRVRDICTVHGSYGANACADNRPPQGAPTPGPTARFKPSRIDPLNREPTTKPGSTVPFKPFRTDPLNREPTAKPDSTAPFKPFRIDPLNREPTAKPGSTVPFKPFRTEPLNRELTAKPTSTVPFRPFRIEPLNREPTAKTGAAAPRGSGSNASSAAATAQPARALTLLPSRDCPGHREQAKEASAHHISGSQVLRVPGGIRHEGRASRALAHCRGGRQMVPSTLARETSVYYK
jgi:hypothetical protein